jgi:hypothetical protein
MIVTMTTVGYGDVTPSSVVGKCIAVMCMCAGVIFMTMPIAIMGSNFVTVWADRESILEVEKIKAKISFAGITPQHVLEMFQALDQDDNGSISVKE